MTEKTPIGEFDRRITIQKAASTTDAAGDEVKDFDSPELEFKLFAKRHVSKSPFTAAGTQQTAEQILLHQTSIVWEVRFSERASLISPELYRVVYKGRVYEIISDNEGHGRSDRIYIRTASRPDTRGSVAPS